MAAATSHPSQNRPPSKGAVSLSDLPRTGTWAQRLVRVQRLRPGYAEPEDTDAEWCALARRILEQGLADAEAAGRSRPPKFRDTDERWYVSASTLYAWFCSDWCALVCEAAGVGWRPYMRAGLSLLKGQLARW